ncbi:MAG: hypothetical protein EAZ91_20890 [Cytophagales bacterium]|nr:MAG: hypothetical protein EAZ91_20890 [Cytophagales bacterium]
MPSALLANLRHLQAAIARLKTERGHVQQLIDQYDQLLNVRLGALTAQLQELRQAVQQKQATFSRRRSEQDRFTENRDGRNAASPTLRQRAVSSEQFRQHLTSNQSTNQPAPDTLKKLYRQAVSLAHPDRFAGDAEREARATEVMSQLNAAYARDDLEAVSDLLADLEDGLPFLDLPGPDPDPEALERIQKRLTQTHDALVRELATLRQSEAYRIMTTDAIDLTTHFDELERRCLAQLDQLRNELMP